MPDVPQTTIMAIRHGETLWNVEQRFQGHEDSPLTKTGRRQAAALGQRLRQSTFDRLISSDLGRAQETAAIIAEHTGHTLEMDQRLRERHYGVLEGMRLLEIMAEYPDVLAQFNADDPDYIIPDGESHRMHYERNIAWIEEFSATNSGRAFIIVVHGGVLDSLFRYVAQLPLKQPRCFVTANASLSEFVYGKFYGTERWVIRTWGDTGHLTDIGYFRGLG